MDDKCYDKKEEIKNEIEMDRIHKPITRSASEADNFLVPHSKLFMLSQVVEEKEVK